MGSEPSALLQAMAEEHTKKIFEIADLKVKIDDRNRTIEHLRSELGEAQDALNDTINAILDLAPECWDGDAFAGQIAIEFVKALIEHSATKTVHRHADCTCKN
jgi:chromosome segregation ATPase